MTDPWDKWRGALADPHKIGFGHLRIDEEPWTGFFRVRRKGADWEPVQFWQDDFGLWHARRSGRVVDAERIPELWLWACRQPISEEAFDRATNGNGWADEPEHPPTIGHNTEADEFDALTIEFLGEKELADEFLKTPISNADEADRAAIWAKRMADIAKRADTLHGNEVAPLIVARRKVDSKWRELREQPTGYKVLLKRHQDKWLNEQERLERERVAAAAKEAERLRIEAAEAARVAATPEEQAEAGAKVAAAKEAEREAQFRRPQAGRKNQKTTLKTFRSGLITDYDAFIAAAKNEPEIREAAQIACNRLGREERHQFPGMEVVEERRTV